MIHLEVVLPMECKKPISWQLMIMQMELLLTLQETSMWQEEPKGDWMEIAVKGTLTSLWLSTTPVEQSNGRSSLGHQVVILQMELPPTLQETSM